MLDLLGLNIGPRRLHTLDCPLHDPEICPHCNDTGVEQLSDQELDELQATIEREEVLTWWARQQGAD